jgi:hypothetical protein
MLTKSNTVLAAALIFGAASAAVADEQFDVNIYRPVSPPHPLALNGQDGYGAFAQANSRGTIRQAGPRVVKPFTIEEKRLFERTTSPSP